MPISLLGSTSFRAVLVLASLGLGVHAAVAQSPERGDGKPSGKLLPLEAQPLPLGSIKPAGWLRRQLEIQANGLGGWVDQNWPDVADSAWVGGKAEGWERGPYWLDGFIPLAVTLD